jgi:hypothetical protein
MRSVALIGACASVGILLADSGAIAAPPALEASVACERRPDRGRVVCELEAEVREGRLAWADALVVEAPDFAHPLKSRVGPRDAPTRSPQRIRLPIAFFAERTGQGWVSVRSRAVVCTGTGGEACTAASRVARATLVVGPVPAESAPPRP